MRHELIEKQLTILNVSEPLLRLQKEITASDEVVETSREFKANLTTLFNNAIRAIEVSFDLTFLTDLATVVNVCGTNF